MIKKLAITAFALSMSAAFAGTQDKSTTTSSSSAQPGMSMETPKSSMTSSSSADHSQVKQVQQALKDKGQDPGAIDGKMGPKTTAALQSFQQAQGITGSGLDQPTLAALGVSGDASATASSNQPAASTSSTTSSKQPSSTTESSSTNATKQ